MRQILNLIRWTLLLALRASAVPALGAALLSDVIKDVLWGLLLAPSM